MRVINKLKCMICMLLLTTACEEKEYLYNDPSDLVMFNETYALFPVVDGKESEIEIMISSPVVSSVDREYVIGIQQSGVENEAKPDKDYKLKSNRVVIPAGERVGTFTVIGIPGRIPSGTDFFANFMIVSTPNEAEVASFNNVFTLYFSRVCVFDFADMIGDYVIKNTSILSSKDPIQVKVVRGEKDNELVLLEPYGQGIDITITVVPNADGTYRINLPDQHIATGRLNQQTELVEMWARGTGIWDTCNKVMKITMTPYLQGGAEWGTVVEKIEKVVEE